MQIGIPFQEAATTSHTETVEAPNPILPATDEIVWGTIAFLLIFVVLAKYAMPAIKKTMAARAAKIQGDLDSAENAKTQADTMLADYKAQLADARTEANRIIDEARQQAETVRKDMVARAEADAADVRAKATQDLNAQAERIKADLTSHVKSLSLELAGKVVGKNLDDETNAALVDRYIAELGAKQVSVAQGYAAAFVEVAKAEGALATVGSELATFAQAWEGSPALQQALTDTAVPSERRVSVVEALLGGKANPVTTNLVSLVIGNGRAKDLPAIVTAFLDRAADEEGRVAGEVRSAHPLSLEQQQRLTAAIGTATGKKVELKFLVDPTVLGGVVARVGDTVIDGTVRTRLDQLKEAI